MSWKPSRSSGIMYDKYKAAADKNEREVRRMLENYEYLNFDKMNKFSKHLYLWWLNDTKTHKALCGSNRSDPIQCYAHSTILAMLKRNPDYLYKPSKTLFTK